MFKSLFLTFMFLFSSVIFAGNPPKELNISKNWTQVIQPNDNNYNIKTENIKFSSYPSFIITKSVENNKKGLLVKIWISSNTQQNGISKNINLSNISISFFNGKYWQENFNIKFIVVGSNATQVHYFFTNNPNVQVKFKWKSVKINN